MLTGEGIGRSLGNISRASAQAALPQAMVTFSLDPACGWGPWLCSWLEATQGMFSSKTAEVQGPGHIPQAHL